MNVGISVFTDRRNKQTAPPVRLPDPGGTSLTLHELDNRAPDDCIALQTRSLGPRQGHGGRAEIREDGSLTVRLP